MRSIYIFRLFLTIGLAGCLSSAAALAGSEGEKIHSSHAVLKEIIRIPEKGIPPILLKDAYGIAIIPGVIKLGFVVGGKYGSGILMLHEKDNSWSNPTFVDLIAGSIGWQIGAESTDVILVFKTRRSVEGIMRGKFTLGVDASIAAGPVGRNVSAATDVQLKSEIYSYSRSRGVFAGISFEGAALQIDDSANAAFYGKKDVRPADIFGNKAVSPPDSVKSLQKLLSEYVLMS